MRIVIALDSFKGSLSAEDACAAVARGVRLVDPAADVACCPMADGGEGTLAALASAWGAQPVELAVPDAIGRPAVGAYVLRDGVAVVELATANGLPGVSDVPLRPHDATTRGTGQVLRAALEAGASDVLLCVGGSASTDGGAGILTELGARLLDDHGHPVADGGRGLAAVKTLDLTGLMPEARAARWRIAVDVTNPLVGPQGAPAVFGPQKGASPDDVAALDAALRSWASVLATATGREVADLPGAGAAGGVPAGLAAVLDASFEAGATLVAEAVGLPEACQGADLVITGEGRFDSQSPQGKVVAGVVSAAAGAPVLVLAGEVSLAYDEYRSHGVTAAFSIAPGARDLPALQRDAARLLTESAAAAVNLLTFGWSSRKKLAN